MPTIGSQALVRVLPRTHYDFSGLRDGLIRIPIAQHIDVLGYERATLQVRIYSGTLPAKSRLQVHLADDGYSADDTANAFLQTTTSGGEEIGTLQIGEETTFPFYQSISTAVPGVFGRLMAVMVSFTGGSKGGPSVVMSLDLVLSGGSVGSTIYQPSTYLGYANEQVEPVEKLERLTADQPDRTAAVGEEDLAARLSTAIRDELVRGNLAVAKPDGGYPRFRNVDVAIAGRPVAQADQPLVREDALVTRLSTAIREALLRGNLDLETPDGGYARFGNVNVGIGGRVFEQTVQPVRESGIATRLSSAIRDALVQGGLHVTTPDGGYARFGNVNIGIGGKVQVPDLAGGIANLSDLERDPGTETEG